MQTLGIIILFLGVSWMDVRCNTVILTNKLTKDLIEFRCWGSIYLFEITKNTDVLSKIEKVSNTLSKIC